jgi:hypothetical protein
MNVKSTISKLLTNRHVLNAVFIVSLLNVIGYLVYRNFHAVIFFILIAGIVGRFSKNMTVVLLIPLFIVNLFVLGKSKREGMETASKDQIKEKAQNNAQLQDTVKKINQKVSTKQGLPITPIDTNEEATTTTSTETTAEESFEVGRNKKGYDIDYASTIEDAYDELNKIIGGDGIKNLTSDTQNLMKQQLQLAEAMKSMEPLIANMGPLMQSVAPMLEKANVMMGSGSGSIADMAKNFNVKK